MNKLLNCVLIVAITAISLIILCAEGNKAVAQPEPDLAHRIGRVEAQTVYKFNDGGNECYVIIGGSARPAISCTR